MQHLKQTLQTGAAVVFRLLVSLGINKVFAYQFGPIGTTLLNQFQNLLSLGIALPLDGVNRATIKYGNKNAESILGKGQAFAASLIWNLFCFLAAILVFLSTTGKWLPLLQGNYSATYFLGMFFAGVALQLFHTYNMSVLLAKLEITFQSYMRTASGVASFVISLLAIYLGGSITNGLLWYGIAQGAGFFITIWFALDGYVFKWPSKKALIAVGHFVAMAASIALFGRVTDLVVRTWAIEHFPPLVVGYWQAVYKLSDSYISLTNAIVATAFFPVVASLMHQLDGNGQLSALKKYMKGTWQLAIPSIIVLLGVIFLAKKWVLVFLFSTAFLPAIGFVKWQLITDFFRIISMLPATMLVAKAKTGLMVASEGASMVVYLLFLWWLTPLYGVEGILLANLGRYILYCGYMLLLYPSITTADTKIRH